MIFAGKNYLEVLDEFIDRHVLPPSIAPGGSGCVAMGLPPLIGDVAMQSQTSQPRKNLGRSDLSLPSTVSLGESDDDSASSHDSSRLDVSVSGSFLMKGQWVESGGSSQVFTSPFA